MAANITTEIGSQNYELVLDRIGEILTVELKKQFDITKNVLYKAKIFKERIVPLDKTEIPAINIYYENSEYETNTPISSFGESRYIIEVSTSAKFSDTERGDTLSSILVNKLAGVVRYILEHPSYVRLDFPVSPAFINGTRIESIRKSHPEVKDGAQISSALLFFVVRLNEDNGNLVAVTAEGYTTQVKINSSDKGHEFIINNE